MNMQNDNVFEIEKQIYNTQWNNIRHHWDETVKAMRYLSTLIIFAIIPLKFLSFKNVDNVNMTMSPESIFYLKTFVFVLITSLGLLTVLNQYNHYKRSKEARKVIVEIEKKWRLYDNNDRFIFQDSDSNYNYGKFAGGECRISHSHIQFGYIISITIIGLGFVYFA